MAFITGRAMAWWSSCVMTDVAIIDLGDLVASDGEEPELMGKSRVETRNT